MGRAAPLTIGSVHFEKKADARSYVRELIAKYKVGDYLNQTDSDFCSALFKRHSEHREKIGAGLKSIEVRLDDYGNKHFQLHRLDGTNIDISWVHCITPKKS